MARRSVSYFVIYRGVPHDKERFIDHYKSVHVPILARWPGIQKIHLHTSIEWTDPEPVNRADATLIVEMVFDSTDALHHALGSKERVEARADFRQFPQFAGVVLHQATNSELVYG